jgi:hypothetical protein
MNKWLLIFPFLFVGTSSFSQFVDDFSDGNFSENPNWVGDTSKFIVDDSLKLQLVAPAETNEAQLFTQSKAVINGHWEALIQMDFNPSSSNKSGFIINSNTAMVGQPLTGYYVEIGGTSDEVSFYKSVNNNTTKLIDGSDGMLNTNAVNLRVKVTNDSLGNWQLYADTTGNFNFELIGTAFDNEITTCAYTGIWCDYTSTRSTKFWFDDFIVTGDTLPDLIAPKLISKQLQGDSLLSLSFDEKIDSAITVSVTPEISFGKLYQGNKVTVTFLNRLQNGIMYVLTLSHLQDLSGNQSPDSTFTIQYLKDEQAMFRDVVFNEIIADPSPINQLPEHEFIELYNRSEKVINLVDWSLVNSNISKPIPEFILLPQQYILLAPTSAVTDLSGYGNVLGISGWVALTNAGDDIQLLNNEQVLIDELNYDDTWYENDTAKAGGWTLEQIDYDVFCTTKSNWTASKGSPNEINKHVHVGFDQTPPTLSKIISVNQSEIVFEISENINSDFFSSQSVSITPSTNLNYSNYDPLTNVITLGFETLQSNIPYQITLDLKDCSGNQNQVNTSNLYIPEAANRQDVVINELLFNPFPVGADFVELLNISDKHLDLSQLNIGVIKSQDTTWSSTLASNYKLLSPKSYAYFSEDTSSIMAAYSARNGLEIASLPAMNDDEGNVILKSSNQVILDEVVYSQNDHFEAIQHVEGISLEKINPNTPSESTSENWHSAASSVGYATPGYQNSQFNNTNDNTSSFSLGNLRISPNNDGIDDLLTIHINSSPGIGTIKIYSLAGIEIITLQHQMILGQENMVYWDGLDSNGQITPAGNYIIFAELVLENGTIKRYKEAFAVVTHE